MKETEKLHFKIGFSGEYWDKKPKYSILINSTVVKIGEVTTPSNELFYVDFDFEFEESTKNKLGIRLNNKSNSDTVENTDKTLIIKDMLLHIKSLEIDEIDVGQLLWSNTQFIGDEKSRPILKNCIDLGWNGTWEFPFESPFYMWLLENI